MGKEMSPRELQWELEFTIHVTRATGSEVHRPGHVNLMAAGVERNQLVKVGYTVYQVSLWELNYNDITLHFLQHQ